MTQRTAAQCLLAAGALFLLGSAGGCSSDRVSASDIRGDMSPEMESIAMTSEQRKNTHARVFDTDLRQIWDDLDMILLLDKPVRLTRYPVP